MLDRLATLAHGFGVRIETLLYGLEHMRRASRIVLNPTADGVLELRTDAKIIRYPDRYTDPRGNAIWANVLGLLEEYRRQADTASTAARTG